MRTRYAMSNASVLAAALACLAMAITLTTVYAKEELPEVSKDGLHLLKKTKVRIAYAKPGVTLDKYTKVKILDCFVQFREDWEHDYNLGEVGLSGRVTDKDVARIKQLLAEEFEKVFTEQLTEAGHEVVDAVGPEVLLLRPAIINLDVTAPDLSMHQAGLQTTVVASAGQMTLYMELYDSATSELLARVIDPRADPGGMAMRANRVTNRAAADRILRRWADLLADHLGDVQENAGS